MKHFTNVGKAGLGVHSDHRPLKINEELKAAIELHNKEQTRRRFRSYSKGRTVGQL